MSSNSIETDEHDSIGERSRSSASSHAQDEAVDLQVHILWAREPDMARLAAKTRKTAEFVDASDELLSLIWQYDHQGIDENRERYPRGLTVRTKTMGALRPADLTEYQWGHIHGRFEAMLWALGSDWDDNWHDDLDASR